MEKFKKVLISFLVIVVLIGVGFLLFDNYVLDVIPFDLDNKHSLSVEPNYPDAGNITLDHPVGNVKIGTVVNLSVEANHGYIFSGWYIGNECISEDSEFA